MSETQRRGHRLHAAMWDWTVKRENAHYREARQEVAAGSRGRVLELGVGTGPNWAFLPPGIEYLGIEPPSLLPGARAATPRQRAAAWTCARRRRRSSPSTARASTR